MRNINQPSGQTSDTRFLPAEYPYYNAIIEDVVINEEGGSILKYNPDGSNLGEVLFRAIPDDRGLPVINLRKAYPLEANIQEYPLIGEAVLIFKTFGGFYYSRPLNMTRKLSENSQFFIRDQYTAQSKEGSSDRRELASRGAIPEGGNQSTSHDLGKYFPPVGALGTKSVRPNEGDVLIQGRFGNAIRVGSSLVKTPVKGATNPNILLTAGFWNAHEEVSATENGAPTDYSLIYENINEDRSSIWMVSNQKVDFLASTALSTSERKAHLLNATKTVEYTGAQIFINSDRIILNSKANEISLFSNKEINLSSIGSITLDTEKNIYLRAFSNINIKADNIVSIEGTRLALTGLRELAIKTHESYSIIGKQIFIGTSGDTTEPMVMGASLAGFLQKLITTISTNINTGIVATPTGPGTVTFPTLVAALELLSTSALGGPVPQLAAFNSRSNFTTETNSV